MVIIRERQKKKKKKMDKKLVLFPNHQIAKRKYKKRRKMLHKILFRLIQQQEIFDVCLLSRDEIVAITVHVF